MIRSNIQTPPTHTCMYTLATNETGYWQQQKKTQNWMHQMWIGKSDETQKKCSESNENVRKRHKSEWKKNKMKEEELDIGNRSR